MAIRRKLILGSLTISLLLIVFNLHKIRFTIDLLNLYRDEKINHIISEPNIIKEEVNNPLLSIQEEYSEDSPALLDSPNKVDRDPEKIKSPSKKNNILEAESKSYISIVSEYNGLLLEMQSSFENTLDKLVKEAMDEYTKTNTSKSKLANKYISLGSSLEKDCDLKFKKIINSMKEELEANGHPTSIIKETEDYYTSFKSTKKSDIIARGMKHLD